MKIKWIKAPVATEQLSITFKKAFKADKEIVAATLKVSVVGLYEAYINEKKVGDRVLTPGFTNYNKRILFQTYDVTDLLKSENTISITCAPGWAIGHLGCFCDSELFADHISMCAEIEITYADGSCQTVSTDESWSVYTDQTTFSSIYDGETIDKTVVPNCLGQAVYDDVKFPLVSDDGAPIKEQDVTAPCELITTPKGERVIDFGQNMAGYVSLKIKGNRGEKVVLRFGEVLDKDGNFYNANYRSAQNKITYVLSGEEDYFKPRFSFQGFRYALVAEYPDQEIDINGFRAITVHTEMSRTSDFVCGNEKINQLYHNIVWGQKSNYLDIPTDCPQRDERLGWTGDTQVFTHIAAINYDVRMFFKKWLADLRSVQYENGAIPGICPDTFGKNAFTRISAGWGDVATITPWVLYNVYDDTEFLRENFDMMKKWVEYIRNTGDNEYLWLGGYHYGDWLAMDASGDSYVGATSNDLVASAFYVYSINLLIQAGKVLNEDVSEYCDLRDKAVAAFRKYFMEDGLPKEEFPYTEVIPEFDHSPVDTVRRGVTQTAIVLILHFGLCTDDEREKLINKLEELIHDFDDRMSTGFLGTPYILHVLSEHGKSDLAYKLLFNEGNPSWLYSVNHGATTMWEHWNSIKEDGSFWSTDMNSFNHYAYGAVGDWLFGVVAGIKIREAGYKKITIAPMPDKRLGFVKTHIDTVNGRVESNWYYKEDRIMFEFSVPVEVEAEIILPDGYREIVCGGKYRYSITL